MVSNGEDKDISRLLPSPFPHVTMSSITLFWAHLRPSRGLWMIPHDIKISNRLILGMHWTILSSSRTTFEISATFQRTERERKINSNKAPGGLLSRLRRINAVLLREITFKHEAVFFFQLR